MRKIISISALLLALLVSCQKEYNYTITANLDNLTDSLVFLSTARNEKVDTIHVVNGGFTFKGKVDTLLYMTLYIPEPGIWLDIWTDADNKISITGDLNFPGLIEVKGSTVNNKLNQFKTANRKLLKEKAKLFHQQQEAVTDSIELHTNELNFSSKISNIIFQLEQKAEEFIKENPGSLASLVLIRDYLADPENLEKFDYNLSLIEAPATQSNLYGILNTMLEKAKQTSIGTKAPDFSIIDIKGDTLTLSSFQGKPLLLTFAASWCKVCRKDNKELVAIHNKFHKKGLQVFTVSFDEIKEDWKKAAKEDNITWKQAIDTEGWGAEMLNIYNITSIPSNFLLDKEGVIVHNNLFGTELEEAINEMLTP